MPIAGSGSSAHPSGDPHKSRAAAARRAEEATPRGGGSPGPDPVPPVRSPLSVQDEVVGGRVLRIDSEQWIDVAPERLARWLANFGERHADGEGRRAVALGAVPHGLRAEAADGTIADCFVPFVRSWAPAADADLAAAATAHALAARTVGVLLVRLGGFAVGVFEGSTLVSSKVGGKPVASRQSNGGWSQSRYANRRANQAETHLAAAADTAARVLAPAALDALVLGGEGRAVTKVLADARLAPLVRLGPEPEPRIFSVPDPNLAVLKAMPELYTAIKIRLLKPDAGET